MLGRSWWRLSSQHSADEVELLRLLQTPTFAVFVVAPTTARPPSSSTDDTVQLSTIRRRLRLIADFTASTTVSDDRRPVADSEAQSTSHRLVYSLHPVADLPASTTCRRLLHISDATDCWRHVNDDNLLPAPRASNAAWLRCIFFVAC